MNAALYLFLVLFSAAYSQCVFTSTECQCTLAAGGGLCLRYFSGTDPNVICEAYTCGAGYICDCNGSDMCDITACSRDVYQATGIMPTSVGETVPCERMTKLTCLYPRVPPSNSPTPTSSTSPSSSTTSSPSSSPSNSASNTPTPSISSTSSASTTPTTSPSSTQTPTNTPTPSNTPTSSSTPSASTTPTSSVTPSPSITPSISASNSPSSSTTPSVTPSNSPPTIAEWGACGAGDTCAVGLDCNCFGQCTQVYTYNFENIGDNYITPFFCSSTLHARSIGWEDRISFTHTEACVPHMFYSVENDHGSTGMIASISIDGGSTWYNTDRGIGLVTFEPTETTFLTDGNYDFSGWEVTQENLFLRGQGAYLFHNLSYGGTVWSHLKETPDISLSYYKMDLPFCQP